MTLLYHSPDVALCAGPLHSIVRLVRRIQQPPQLSWLTERPFQRKNSNNEMDYLEQDDLVLPNLSDTEVLRTTSLIAIGVVGCIYTLMVLSLTMIKDIDWWTRVCTLYPGQSIVEPSTAMFGISATQASMLSHRAGKAGVAPVRVSVPLFTCVCILLAVLPCACLLYWLSDQITVFELYSMQ